MDPEALNQGAEADHDRASATEWLFILVALGGTVLLGVWLRWFLAGAYDLPLPLSDLRHAHSHLGYFGLLFPLAWLGWRAAGSAVPGRRPLLFYAACTVLATIGFVQAGYGPVAIAGCTLVSAVWLWSLGPILGRMRDLQDPLGAVPIGLLLSLACVPPIAIYLRSEPALAQGFVSTFLSGLLFVVVVPSTLAGGRVAAGPWPILLAAGAASALALGVLPSAMTHVGLVVFALVVGASVWRSQLPWVTRCSWLPVALGLVAMAVGILPNSRSVALGAIHFLILGPVLATLAPLWLRRAPSQESWAIGHLTWGVMSAALVAQSFGGGAWTWTLAAAAGTGTLFWWVIVLSRQR